MTQQQVPKPPPPMFPSVPQSRTYRHLTCNCETTVNGTDYLRLCNPNDVAWATFCVNCRRAANFDQFVWLDTGENLAAYRQRLKSLPPLSAPRRIGLRWLIALGSPVALGGIGELLLSRNPNAERGIGFAFGAMLGFFAGVGAVLIMNRANPIDYRGYRQDSFARVSFRGAYRITIDSPTGNIGREFEVRIDGPREITVSLQ